VQKRKGMCDEMLEELMVCIIACNIRLCHEICGGPLNALLNAALLSVQPNACMFPSAHQPTPPCTTQTLSHR
jgi:hypothetical protein